jgi:hypothetical protein
MNRLLCPSRLLVCFVFILGCMAVASAAPQMIGVSADDMRRQSQETADRLNLRIPSKSDDLDSRKAVSKSSPDTIYNRKLSEAQKKLVSPEPADLATYREFLRQEHTGIIRLLPFGKYDAGTTVAADRSPDTLLPIRGGGAFYSFAERSQAFGPWSEIALDENRLASGFVAESLGMIAPIGDVPLESLTPKSSGIDYLARYTPPVQSSEAGSQRKRNIGGLRVGAYVYRSVVLAVVNQTYVMRTVLYKKQGRMRVASGGDGTVYVPRPDEYKGADELIAFRVVRISSDGSMTILWKRLQKYDSFSLKSEAASK